jgi:DNA recombination protein RmuC
LIIHVKILKDLGARIYMFMRSFMENLFLIVLVLNSIILIGLLFRRQSSKETSQGLGETMARNNQDILKAFFDFSQQMKSSQKEDFDFFRSRLEDRMEKINEKVEKNLDKGIEKGQETFSNVLERLSKIDEAQKKIEGLSQEVGSLQDILTDKKTRGIFGEVQLNHILSSVFGEQNTQVFETQKTLSNGKIVDAFLHLPEPLGDICVDSKFPLENFKKMNQKEISSQERKEYEKEFIKNVKKHINDIAEKYIITGETSDQAILFLPAEAIFAEIHAYQPEIINYAHKNRIWITSPTTFLATLTTIQSIMINIERGKYMNIMHDEINRLGDEFDRYQTRWTELSRHMGTIHKDVEKVHITSDKISKSFERIRNVDFEKHIV